MKFAPTSLRTQESSLDASLFLSFFLSLSLIFSLTNPILNLSVRRLTGKMPLFLLFLLSTHIFSFLKNVLRTDPKCVLRCVLSHSTHSHHHFPINTFLPFFPSFLPFHSCDDPFKLHWRRDFFNNLSLSELKHSKFGKFRIPFTRVLKLGFPLQTSSFLLSSLALSLSLYGHKENHRECRRVIDS